ncbi:MAG: MBL fold metallo-hydrolase [Burkholderiaceae bacterium]
MSIGSRGAAPVERLPASVRFIQRDWLSCNQIVLLDDDGGATLIDSGYVKHAADTVERVRAALDGRPLARLINTHLHSDHCGGNAAIADAFGCPIYVPQAEYAAASAWDEDALTFRATGQRCPRFAVAGRITPGQWLTMGGMRWRALAAPGHHPHSLIFHCADARLLISADALWRNGFGVIFPELSDESGFDEQRAVLDLIRALPVDLVLPGHGPVFDDVAAALAIADGRLAAMRGDARRNARSAIKVLVKFMLLDRERMPRSALGPLAESARIIADAAGQVGVPGREALERAVDELAAQGLARIEDGWILDAEPRASASEGAA